MDVLRMQDSAMQGVANYVEWKRKFLASWQEKMMLGQIKQAFAMMPPDMKEMLKKQDPQGYERVMSMMQGGSYGS